MDPAIETPPQEELQPVENNVSQDPSPKESIKNRVSGKLLAIKAKKRLFTVIAISGFLFLIILYFIPPVKSYITEKRMFKTGNRETGESQKTTVDKKLLLTTGAPLSANMPIFARFNEEKISTTPAIPTYALKSSDLSNLSQIETDTGRKLSAQQLGALENTGFFFTPADNTLADGDVDVDFSHGDPVDEFVKIYYDILGSPSELEREPQDTVFISSDFILHTYHVFVDRTFQYIEQTQFHPKLLQLTNILFEKSLQEYESTSDETLKASFSRLATFYLVPKVLLESQVSKYDFEATRIASSPETDRAYEENDKTADSYENTIADLEKYRERVPDFVYETAKQELTLIMAAKEANTSPLFGKFNMGIMDDYTQYKPRSHYVKNSTLRSYWRTMIWYGRSGFLTNSDELTLDALIQTMWLNSTGTSENAASTLWESLYLPTVFFVGKSDDLTFYDYSDVLEKVFSKVNPDYSELIEPGNFANLKNEVKNLAGPQIQSSIIMIAPDTVSKEDLLEETKSFRFMGQRFVPDSFIYSTLTQGDEPPDKETGQKLPTTPTALMAMSIFGNQRAKQYLNEWITKEAPEADKVLAREISKLETSFNALDEASWTQNMYWSWLYTLKGLSQQFFQGYPVFMQNTAWQDKDLNTSLGSYTELRHDTLLYAKSSYAEMGGGGDRPEPPPVPKGYVEPNLLFFNRVIALAEMTKSGLEANGVLPIWQGSQLDSLIESYKFFRTIAVKELNNEVISDDEFEKLRVETHKINLALTPPDAYGYIKAADTRAGLIADIHTATTQDVQEILYEATGIPNVIYVAVKDANGTRLTRGVTYSYYEFTRPFGERLSDADWQANIYEGQENFTTPNIPDWAKTLQK